MLTNFLPVKFACYSGICMMKMVLSAAQTWDRTILWAVLNPCLSLNTTAEVLLRTYTLITVPWLNIRRKQIWVCHSGLNTNFEIRGGIWHWIKAGPKTRKMSYEPKRSAHRDPQESPLKFWTNIHFFTIFRFFIVVVYSLNILSVWKNPSKICSL